MSRQAVSRFFQPTFYLAACTALGGLGATISAVLGLANGTAPESWTGLAFMPIICLAGFRAASKNSGARSAWDFVLGVPVGLALVAAGVSTIMLASVDVISVASGVPLPVPLDMVFFSVLGMLVLAAPFYRLLIRKP